MAWIKILIMCDLIGVLGLCIYESLYFGSSRILLIVTFCCVSFGCLYWEFSVIIMLVMRRCNLCLVCGKENSHVMSSPGTFEGLFWLVHFWSWGLHFHLKFLHFLSPRPLSLNIKRLFRKNSFQVLLVVIVRVLQYAYIYCFQFAKRLEQLMFVIREL